MREELADKVYAVFRYGLDLKERVKQSPESEDLYREQSQLKELLRQIPDERDHRPDQENAFLGIRFPLTCWLDEIFILDSPWKSEWNEQSLEQSLYGSRDRAWKFWKQAEWVEARVSADALEIFYLCVMLGFRGERYNKLDQLKEWHQKTLSVLLDNQKRRWTEPDVPAPRTYVPPLSGSKRKRSMLLMWAISLLVLIPVAIFFLIRRMT